MAQGIQILGTGSYLPRDVLSNGDLAAKGLDTSDEWIFQRTGIRERRVARPEEATSDLAAAAAAAALDMAGLDSRQVGLIIVATITPDTCCPSAANWLQAKLDAPQAVTFDIAAACSGFIFALHVATQYLKSGAAETVLVVASEIMTRAVDWDDRSTCILWGDGAGAALLTRGDGGHQILSSHIHTDGANGRSLLLPGGGSSTTPISHASVDRKAHTLAMPDANLSFRVAVRRFTESIEEAAAFNHVGVHDVAHFIPHQANLRMFQFISERMGIPMEKFYLTMHKYGNISSASCAIALDEAVRDGSVRDGHLVCLPVFGGGLTWGSAMIRW